MACRAFALGKLFKKAVPPDPSQAKAEVSAPVISMYRDCMAHRHASHVIYAKATHAA